MKYSFAILFIATVTFFACNSKNQSPEEKENAFQDSIKYAKAAEAKIDSLTKKLAGQFEEVLPESIVASVIQNIIKCISNLSQQVSSSRYLIRALFA